jgi:phosphate transport system substrate-binding protein
VKLLNSRFIPAALALGALAFSACGTTTGGTPAASPTPSYSGTVTAAGSTALQPLVAAAKDLFEAKNPSATVQVNGGGSGTGLSQVASGAVDIGNSDIPASAATGLQNADQLVDHQVAVVAFAIIVNPSVSVTNLTQAQAQKVISGQVTNWKDVGGNDQKIAVILRPASSGTHKVFNKIVMGTVADIATPAATQDATGTVVQTVGQTPGAVSYVALSGIKDSSVKKVQYEGVDATPANVENGTYKIWSHEHMYTKGQPTGAVDGFIKYILSNEFQTSSAMTTLGFIPTNKVSGKSGADG